MPQDEGTACRKARCAELRWCEADAEAAHHAPLHTHWCSRLASLCKVAVGDRVRVPMI